MTPPWHREYDTAIDIYPRASMHETNTPRWLHLQGCDVDLQRLLVVRSSGDTRLSEREAQVLRLLWSADGDLVRREVLERQIWQLNELVVSEAVPVAMRRLRGKIELDPSTPLNLRTVRGAGWALERAPRSRAPLPRVLPVQFDPYMGGEARMQPVRERLGQGGGLLTLRGTGGVGKTRLALEVVRRWQDSGHDVVFCELAPCADGAALVHVVANALGVQGSSDLERSVGQALSARAEVVLVLDNVEHLVDDLIDLVVGWMREAPTALFILTSREALGLSCEQVMPVEPLHLADAVELLRERAERRSPGCLANASDRDLQQIVDGLDLIPLAIELAASRLGVLGPERLLQRLVQPLRVLVGNDRSRPTRQRTLRATVDWSWRLLTTLQRRCLADMCAFAAPASLVDLEQVLLPDLTDCDLVLQELLERSLVRVAHAGADRVFSPYHGVRAFVRETAPDAVAEAEHRHLTWAAQQAELCALRAAQRMSVELLTRLTVLHPELSAARRRTHTPEHLVALTLAMSLPLRARGPQTTRLALLRAAWTHRAGAGALLPVLIHQLGHALWKGGQPEEARALLRSNLSTPGLWWARNRLLLAQLELRHGQIDQADELIHFVHDRVIELPPTVQAEASALFGHLHGLRGDTVACIESMEHACALLAPTDDVLRQLWAASMLGTALYRCGELHRARSTYQQIARRQHEQGNRLGMGQALNALAEIASRLDRPSDAERRFHEALAVLKSAGTDDLMGVCSLNLGALLMSQARYSDAEVVLQQANTHLSAASYNRPMWVARANLSLIQWARGDASAAQRGLKLALAGLASDDVALPFYLAMRAGCLAETHDMVVARRLQVSALCKGLDEPTASQLALWMDHQDRGQTTDPSTRGSPSTEPKALLPLHGLHSADTATHLFRLAMTRNDPQERTYHPQDPWTPNSST